MIVFISDLHLTDHTCETVHLGLPAFEGTFQDIAVHARKDIERRHRQAAATGEGATSAAEEVQVVLLGDTFDLIHTEFWLDVPPEERPWRDSGRGGDPSEDQAAEALQAILRQNRDVFSLMRELAQPNGLLDRFGLARPEGFNGEIKTTFTYVPGNHDRLCNKYPKLRALVSEALGRDDDPNKPFSWRFHDPEHRVVALHGCQLDEWNWVPGTDGDPGIPIGDVITAMFVSALPRHVEERLKVLASDEPVSDSLSPGDVARIGDGFRGMFDVRPYGAIVPWLLDRIEKEAPHRNGIRAAIEEAVDGTVMDFRSIPFVRQWLGLRWSGKQLLIRMLLSTLKRASLLSLRRVPGLVNWVYDRVQAKSAHRFLAGVADLMEEAQVDFAVLGHTHTPLQAGVGVRRPHGSEPTAPDGARELLYLNTGTWRPRFEQVYDRSGFVAMKGLTYVIIYGPTSDEPRLQVSESWTGMLKDEDVALAAR